MSTEHNNTNDLGPLVRVFRVSVVDEYNVAIEFEDGTVKTVDLEPYLAGPVFDSIRHDPALFRQIEIRGGTLAWPSGADIDPDVLYYGLTPAWMEATEDA